MRVCDLQNDAALVNTVKPLHVRVCDNDVWYLYITYGGSCRFLPISNQNNVISLLWLSSRGLEKHRCTLLQIHMPAM